MIKSQYSQSVVRGRLLAAAVLVVALALPASAQFKDGTQAITLDLPRVSQKATVIQRVGVTDITVVYSRPLAHGRQLWGKEIPYGKVWRAGANENTTIEFTDAVTVEGEQLAAGKYGLHTIPDATEWTIIFSKINTAWGSFTYKPEEDALRVKVKPHTTALHEALTYDFDLAAPDTAILNLEWGTLAVPVTIHVDVPQITLASIHKQMRGSAGFNPMGYLEAAEYLFDNNLDLNEALKDADGSIQGQPTFQNLMLKSKIEQALGKNAEALAARKQALETAQAPQLYNYARSLQMQKNQTEAMEIFRLVAKRYPDDWIARLSNARLRSSEQNFTAARSEMKVALAGAPDQLKPQLENLLKRLEANEDINQ